MMLLSTQEADLFTGVSGISGIVHNLTFFVSDDDNQSMVVPLPLPRFRRSLVWVSEV